MSSLKDLERVVRLCEKEIDTLADQLAQKETSLRLEVDRLRLGLEALKRYMTDRDSAFPDAYRRAKRQIMREVEGEAEE
jgi:uncharacterized coiled-coil protein SlyX